MTMIMSILAFSLSVLVVAKLHPAVHVRGFGSAMGVAVVYGLLKFFFYKILVFMSLPFIFITLGLFLVVINAGLLWTTDKLIDGFKIDGLFSTLVASVMISLLDILFRWVLPWV